jgi:hypothetical protein
MLCYARYDIDLERFERRLWKEEPHLELAHGGTDIIFLVARRADGSVFPISDDLQAGQLTPGYSSESRTPGLARLAC